MFYIKEQKNIIDMLFPDAAEYNLILESIGNFAEKEILPNAKKFPRQNLEKVANQDITAIPFPKDHNGIGTSLFCIYYSDIHRHWRDARLLTMLKGLPIC